MLFLNQIFANLWSCLWIYEFGMNFEFINQRDHFKQKLLYWSQASFKMGLFSVEVKKSLQHTKKPFYKLKESQISLKNTNIATVSFDSDSIANLWAKIWNVVSK